MDQLSHLAATRLTIGDLDFQARLRSDLSPVTCGWLGAALPLRLTLLHARWSGEACWAPLGLAAGLPHENVTRHPAPGEVLLYAGGVSEPEMLLAYGPVSFASKAGALAGNPVLTITAGLEKLAAAGRSVLWRGATDMQIALEGAWAEVAP